MSTTKPEETEKVKLAKPHTHEGKDYAAGEELTLGKSIAKWLRDAKVVETTQTAAPAAPADKA